MGELHVHTPVDRRIAQIRTKQSLTAFAIYGTHTAAHGVAEWQRDGLKKAMNHANYMSSIC